MQKLENILKSKGRVTREIMEEFFSQKPIIKIRDTIEQMGLDRHMPIELCSCEIAILTPYGILMQIRQMDNEQLGLWGGVIREYESPENAAIRELFEETGILITRKQLEPIEVDVHEHTYSNGDKAVFKSYRYMVRFDQVPKVTTDAESVGVIVVSHTILSHQHDFIKRLLGEK